MSNDNLFVLGQMTIKFKHVSPEFHRTNKKNQMIEFQISNKIFITDEMQKGYFQSFHQLHLYGWCAGIFVF